MMSTATSVMYLLLLLLWTVKLEAIRLEDESMAAFQKKPSQVEIEMDATISEEGTRIGGPGKNRKLTISTTSTTTKATATPKNGGEVGKDMESGTTAKRNAEVHPVVATRTVRGLVSSEKKMHGKEKYHDALDLVGMDYSPANRKPPIHN